MFNIPLVHAPKHGHGFHIVVYKADGSSCRLWVVDKTRKALYRYSISLQFIKMQSIHIQVLFFLKI